MPFILSLSLSLTHTALAVCLLPVCVCRYANATYSADCDVEYVVPDLQTRNCRTSSSSYLVHTPHADYCLRSNDSVYWGVWMQFLCILLMITFLVRLRILSTR